MATTKPTAPDKPTYARKPTAPKKPADGGKPPAEQALLRALEANPEATAATSRLPAASAGRPPARFSRGWLAWARSGASRTDTKGPAGCPTGSRSHPLSTPPRAPSRHPPTPRRPPPLRT
jgi:hypothetical protein